MSSLMKKVVAVIAAEKAEFDKKRVIAAYYRNEW